MAKMVADEYLIVVNDHLIQDFPVAAAVVLVLLVLVVAVGKKVQMVQSVLHESRSDVHDLPSLDASSMAQNFDHYSIQTGCSLLDKLPPRLPYEQRQRLKMALDSLI